MPKQQLKMGTGFREPGPIEEWVWTTLQERAAAEGERRKDARRARGARRWTVYDRAGFASAVRGLLQEYYEGVVLDAALPPKEQRKGTKRKPRRARIGTKNTGVTRSTLQRWISFDRPPVAHSAADLSHLEVFRTHFITESRKLGELQADDEATLRTFRSGHLIRINETTKALKAAIDEKKQKRFRTLRLVTQLDQSLTGPLTKVARERYDRWLESRLLRHELGGEEKEPLCDDFQQGFYVASALDLVEGFKNEFDTFRKQMHVIGHEPKRIQLSILRIIDPLVEAQVAGPIERTAFGKTERYNRTFYAGLKAFVKQGIARERFILQRPAADVREISEADLRRADPYYDAGLSGEKSEPSVHL